MSDLVVCVFLLGLGSPSVHAQCVEYTDYMHLLGVEESTRASGPVRRLAVSGDYAYVAKGETGLAVVNLADPANPQLMGVVDTPGTAVDVALYGGFAFVADGESGLQIIDVADPLSLSIVGSVGVQYYAAGVEIQGSEVYVAGGFEGILRYDISNPTTPLWLSTTDTPDYAHDLVVSGSWIYVADHSSIRSYQYFLSPYPAMSRASVNTGSWIVTNVELSGSLLFYTEGRSGYSGHLGVFDVSSTDSWTWIGVTFNIDDPADLVLSGDFAYLATSGRLAVVDISTPSFSYEVGGFYPDGGACGVAVSGAVACLSSGGGLHLVDVSNPTNPPASNVNTPGSARDVAVSQDLGVIADGTSGIQTVDLSDLANPQLLGTFDTPGEAVGVAIEGDRVFVADLESGLQVLDVTVPHAPVLVGSSDTPGESYAVTLVGSLAYVADGTSGLQIFDVSDPTTPDYVGSVDTPGVASYVTVSGNYAYIVGDNSGLQIADITDPGMPSIVASTGISDTRDVAVADGYAYVATRYSGLAIYDVSDPLSPQFIVRAQVPGMANSVVLDKGYAYVGDLFYGIYVFDVSDVTNPTVFGFAKSHGGWTQRLAVSGEYILAASDSDGLSISPAQCTPASAVDRQVTQTHLLVGAYPNPFNPQTTIAFELPEQEAVSLQVFDVAGRLVSVLLEGQVCGRGRHEAVWQGRDDRGRQVSSGTYFYRLEAGGLTETNRMVLLK